jgi:hypothetical protein
LLLHVLLVLLLVASCIKVTGTKQWRLQMPPTDEVLRAFGEMPTRAFADADNAAAGGVAGGAPASGAAAADGEEQEGKVSSSSSSSSNPRTLVYDFEVKPGEVLVWNVQWYHNTSFQGSDDNDDDEGEAELRTFALTGHLKAQDIRAWARKTGRFVDHRSGGGESPELKEEKEDKGQLPAAAAAGPPRNYFWEAFWTQQHCSNHHVKEQDVGVYDTCWNSWFGLEGTAHPAIDVVRRGAKILVNGEEDR